eukprot:g10448.t1
MPSAVRRVKQLCGHLRPCAHPEDACECCASRRQQLKAIACKNDPATGYSWRDVHDDLEKGIYAGNYGWDF